MRNRISHRTILIVLLVAISTLAFPTQVRSQLAVPSLAAQAASSTSRNNYWFQVGAVGDVAPVTGASVEIRVLSPQPRFETQVVLSYWVGIELDNDAFIQVGYAVLRDPFPYWFWEYFPPGTAKEASVGFLGAVGDPVGPNGTWVKFTIAVKLGTTWSAYVNKQEVGLENLGESSSGSNHPFAIAEVAGATNTGNTLGPVEFRNLSYRDLQGAWHSSGSASIVCCYGAVSRTLPANNVYPYSVMSVKPENNHWLAGSNLPPLPFNAQLNCSMVCFRNKKLFPWHYVMVQGDPELTGWYAEGTDLLLRHLGETVWAANHKTVFKGWSIQAESGTYLTYNDTLSVTENVTVTPSYVDEYYVQVESPLGQVKGSGWYNNGTLAQIQVDPTIIPRTDLLSIFGVQSTFNGWIGDLSGSENPASLRVTRAIVVKALWSVDFGWLPQAIVVAAFVMGVLILRSRLTGRRHRDRPLASNPS